MSSVHHHYSVSSLGCIWVVGDHENGPAVVRIFPQRVQHGNGVGGLQIIRGFIRKYQLRLIEKGSRQGDALSFSNTELSRHVMNAMLQAKMFNQLLCSLFGIRPFIGHIGCQYVLQDIQVGHQVKLLEHKTDILSTKDAPFVGGESVRIDARDKHRAAGWP